MSEKIDRTVDPEDEPADSADGDPEASDDDADSEEAADDSAEEEGDEEDKPSSPSDYEPDDAADSKDDSDAAADDADGDSGDADDSADDPADAELDDASGRSGTHPDQEFAPFLVAPTVAGAFNTLSLDLVPVACLALHDILFAFGSSFVLPGAGNVLQQLPAIRDNRKNLRGEFAPMSIFGHADPVGTDDYNKALSGRRAKAVYGVLTKDTAIWSDLLDHPKDNDNWQTVGALAQMRSSTGLSANTPRTKLIAAYMDFLCPVTIPKTEFLGQGSDAGGKADFQGCSEFNPLVILTNDETNNLPKEQRNEENQPNRRVVIFLFRQRPKVNAQLWPCPRASEGTADCKKRFFLDGEQRRAPGPERRNFSDKGDTFACRFYDRIANVSPCESPVPPIELDVNPLIAFTGTITVPDDPPPADTTASADSATPATALADSKSDAAPQKPAKPPAPPPPPAAPKLGPARQIVVKKKPHTNPARVVVLLKTDTLFTGTGTFTVTPTDEILFFKVAKGGKKMSFKGDNVFTGKALTAGVSLFAEGAKASAAFDNVLLRLALTGGNKKPGPDATAKMTCVEATLTIHTRRPPDKSDPKPLTEKQKLDPGRAVYIQDNTKRQRAKLIVQVKPTSATVKMNAVLKPSNNKVKFFDSETAGTDLGATATLAVDNTFPAAGKLVFAEGIKVSDKFKDTRINLGLQALEDDADHVTMTVVQAQLDICRARVDSKTAPVPFSQADKQKLGRFLMFQNDKKQAARAKVIVQQMKPADFPGTMVLQQFKAKDKVNLFNVEQPGKETALKAPINIANLKLTAKGQAFFGEGTVRSTALIDTGFQLDVKDVEEAADFVSCTVISLHFVKIQTSELPAGGGAMVFKEDDDFAPLLNEKAKIHVLIEGNLPGFNATVQVDIGRVTNRPDKAATTTVNESVSVVAKVSHANTPGKGEVEVDWDGKATIAVARELSNRKTRNLNTAKDVNIPLEATVAGQVVPHGLYVVDQITLLQGTEVLAIDRPDSVDMSLPILANLIFNANWPGTLTAFGIGPFQANIEEGLRRFGGRDYMIRDATLSNRMNVRFITNAGITNAQSIRSNIGGTDASGNVNFGSTPDGPAPLADNIYAMLGGISADITIFPGTFFTFNNDPNIANQTTFRAVWAPMGVVPAQTDVANGAPTARAVDGAGKVTGACTATDANNVTVTLDVNGIPTVATKNAALLPAARAADIQAALQAFVRMVGNTINHETAHGVGVVSRTDATLAQAPVTAGSNKVVINGKTLTSPLNGNKGSHNRVTANTNIVDAGGTRSYPRRIEAAGQPQQHFSATNTTYLRDCIPFDKKDN